MFNFFKKLLGLAASNSNNIGMNLNIKNDSNEKAVDEPTIKVENKTENKVENIPKVGDNVVSNSIKDKVINEIIRVEGGYINHKSDKGGETNFGITVQVARQNGFTGNMKDLPRQLAYDIYQRQYWDINNLDDVAFVSPRVQEEVQDTGVNMGVNVQGRFLQRSLNVLNLKGKTYSDIQVDGRIGPGTIKALKAYYKHRGKDADIVLLRMLNSLQGARYVELAEAREANEDFIFGWFLHRVKI